MKKLLILLAALSMVACGNQKTKEETSKETAPIASEEVTMKKAANEIKEDTAEKAAEVKDATMEKAAEIKDATMEKAAEIKDATIEKTTEVKDATIEKTTEVKDAIDTNILEKDSSTYIVKKGDSLFRIAQKYNVPLTKLVTENNIEDPNDIYIGQEIHIPQN